jgi:uncharacterized membrane protein
MRNLILGILLSVGLLLSVAQPAAAYHYRSHHASVEHRRHMKTLKRVGIGAAGGAGIGALAAGGPGAAIGGVAGAGAGYLYDRHRKHHHRR